MVHGPNSLTLGGVANRRPEVNQGRLFCDPWIFVYGMDRWAHLPFCKRAFFDRRASTPPNLDSSVVAACLLRG
jgi:hypothetical protein